MSTKKPLSLMILAAAVLFAAGTMTGLSLSRPPVTPASAPVAATTNETKPQLVSVMIDTGQDLLGFKDVAIQPNDTVWSVLDGLSSRAPDLAVESEEYPDMGRLVKAMKGFKNGTENRYWQYWVNNQYASVAADKQVVKAGDVVLWKFTASEFKEY